MHLAQSYKNRVRGRALQIWSIPDAMGTIFETLHSGWWSPDNDVLTPPQDGTCSRTGSDKISSILPMDSHGVQVYSMVIFTLFTLWCVLCEDGRESVLDGEFEKLDVQPVLPHVQHCDSLTTGCQSQWSLFECA